ncbi:hypothetical protein THAOC_09334 [Thalassiosira oceanica]|uniref:Uncharacterized protein n=1 Tax=Thalassiosira oceanica TaxID=159749 RepID=K0SWS4_THAOC|nr:hypothetical protein THAOC_09334 [Thalassiosira oceanica]|eukprot:EJK69414.1 hypothetical protein THAOC_09334 [Thalassiosira oceanica]
MTTPPPALLWLSRALAAVCRLPWRTRDDSNFESGCTAATAAQQAGRRTSTAGSSGSDAEWIGYGIRMSFDAEEFVQDLMDVAGPPPSPPTYDATASLRASVREDFSLRRDARTDPGRPRGESSRVFLSVFALGPPLAGRRRSGAGSGTPRRDLESEGRGRRPGGGGTMGAPPVLPGRTAGQHGRGFIGPRATARPDRIESVGGDDLRRDRPRSSEDQRGGSGVYHPTSIKRGVARGGLVRRPAPVSKSAGLPARWKALLELYKSALEASSIKTGVFRPSAAEGRGTVRKKRRGDDSPGTQGRAAPAGGLRERTIPRTPDLPSNSGGMRWRESGEGSNEPPSPPPVVRAKKEKDGRESRSVTAWGRVRSRRRALPGRRDGDDGEESPPRQQPPTSSRLPPGAMGGATAEAQPSSPSANGASQGFVGYCSSRAFSRDATVPGVKRAKARTEPTLHTLPDNWVEFLAARCAASAGMTSPGERKRDSSSTAPADSSSTAPEEGRQRGMEAANRKSPWRYGLGFGKTKTSRPEFEEI